MQDAYGNVQIWHIFNSYKSFTVTEELHAHILSLN